jgi:SAM-dependent methyltransferase
MRFSLQQDNQMKTFYDREFSHDKYSGKISDHGHHPLLGSFIERYRLGNSLVLEIGCGRGAFQDLVTHYVGVDLSVSVGRYLHKPFFCASATALPFHDNSFEAVWSIHVLEHVPDPEAALREMRRVLKPNGLLFLSPAWYCRSWVTQGYPVRPYADLDLKGKAVKASIPVRNSLLFRASYVIPRRLGQLILSCLGVKPANLRYKQLSPNFEIYWMEDSDAVNSLDPFDVIAWFSARGDQCLNKNTLVSKLFVRTGHVLFRINK